MENANVTIFKKDEPRKGMTTYRVIPNEGYILKSKKSGKLFSEATTTDPDKEFEVIAIPITD